MKSRILVAAAVLISVILKIYLASTYQGNYDQESYELVVGIVRAGGNVYAETERYNYSPLWFHVMYGCDSLAQALGLPFHTVLRTFLTLVDTANIALIGLIAAKVRPGGAPAAVLAYALNPITILVVGYHGQFECFAILPLLAAVYLLVSRPNIPRQWIWALAALSLLIKHITVFGVWALLIHSARSFKSAVGLMAGAVAVFLISFLPYLADGGAQGIIAHVFLHKGVTGVYGLGTFLPAWINYPLFLGAIAALPLVEKHLRGAQPVKSLEHSFVSFLALVPGIGEQYFLLPAAWASIAPTRWYWIYTACASLFLAASKYNVKLLIFLDPWRGLLWNIVWAAVMLWFAAYLYELYRARQRNSPSS